MVIAQVSMLMKIIYKNENLLVVMDESIIPATLDFEKPGAYAFAKNPM